MARTIEIPYAPRQWAQKLHNSFKRYFSLIIHRRGGKTTGLINHFQRAALDDNWERQRMKFLMPNITEDELKTMMRNRFYGIVFPTYNQAKTVCWDSMKYYSGTIPGIKFNESELTVRYPNGNKCRLFGSDNPDALRGPAFWGLGFDEYSQQPSNIFGEILSKALADHLGFTIFAGTIKGKNQLYRTHEVAKTNPDEWDYVWQDIDDSLKIEKGITIEFLRRALEDDRKLVSQGLMTQEEYDQEWYLSTTAAIKGAYYAKQVAGLQSSGRFKIIPYDEAIPVYDVWDLGVGPKLAIGFYQRVGNQTQMIDYWEGENNDGIPQAIKALKEKPYIYGRHFAPFDINATDIGTGKKRIEIAKELGWKFDVIPQLKIDDGIEAGRLFFNRLYVDSNNCQYWLDAISQYRQEWDEKRGMFKEIPYHDWTSHPADVHRYAAVVENKMINNDVFIPIIYREPKPNPAR